MVTGNSVIAFTYGEGVIIACDTLGAHPTCGSKALRLHAGGGDDQNLILSVNGAAAGPLARDRGSAGAAVYVDKPRREPPANERSALQRHPSARSELHHSSIVFALFADQSEQFMHLKFR
jgi:hypothetical protein